MDRLVALSLGRSLVSLLALACIAQACGGEPGGDPVVGRGDALADCDPADTACGTDTPPPASCDDVCAGPVACSEDGTCTPCDPAVPPLPCTDCSAQDAFADDATCDTSLGYKWNGASCEQLVGCACVGASCGALWKSGDACKKAHLACPGTTDPCAGLAAALAALLPEVQACNVAAVPPEGACAAIVPTLPAGCGVAANALAPQLPDYEKLWSEYAASCPLTDPPCPDLTGKVGACVQSGAVDSTVGACAWVDGAAADAD